MLRFLKPGVAKALFGARIAFAFAASSLVFAHERHVAAQQPAVVAADEVPFLKENEAAMRKMMNDMEVMPTGDVDKDFAAMMIPHHQGAIDMAVLELRYGKNEQLRRIAQEIIVDQMQEIAAMKLAIGEPDPVSAPAPTQPSPAPATNEHHGMHMHMELPNNVK